MNISHDKTDYHKEDVYGEAFTRYEPDISHGAKSKLDPLSMQEFLPRYSRLAKLWGVSLSHDKTKVLRVTVRIGHVPEITCSNVIWN